MNQSVDVVARIPLEGTFTVKTGLAKMLKGGLIMDVVNAEQARIAEKLVHVQ
jgi:pyridoxal 5'-phosphate synthase pdxS subunit